jgi:soluble lytic murein transglycosylase
MIPVIRFKKILYMVFSLVLLLLIGLGSWYLVKIYYHPSWQKAVSGAETAIDTGNTQQVQTYESKLVGNPLYPYVVFDDLVPRLAQLPTNEVNTFLMTYADTPLADELRQKWLYALANKQQWQQFLHYYQPSTLSALRCLYATALLQTGQTTEAYEQAEALWMVPYSQASECNTLFTAWVADNQLTSDMIHQRFHMALDAEQIALATYLAKLLPADQQARANLWLQVRANPPLIEDKVIFPTDNNQYNTILVYGMKRLAISDANKATNAWEQLKREHHFTYAQVQDVIQAIAVAYIKQDHSKAYYWLQQINPEFLNEVTANWRIRFALEEQNWTLLAEWIATLSPTAQADPQWQYWLARAQEQLGNKNAAQALYQQLAQQRNYYGFLSASRIGVPLVIPNQPLSISHDEVKAFIENPAIQRMKALYAIGDILRGNVEWWYAIAKMTPKQAYVAATMAAKWKLYALALATAGKLPYQDDVALRFPRAFWPAVKKQAAALNMDPAFIYAIIRQESMFNNTAASWVGAQGLMQLMPATADMLIQQDKLPVAWKHKLSEPAVNIELGSLYLNRLLTANSANPALAAAAYNAGPGKVQKWLPLTGQMDADIWIDIIPYTETRTYVKHVLTYMVVYQSLLGNIPTLSAALRPVQAKAN